MAKYLLFLIFIIFVNSVKASDYTPVYNFLTICFVVVIVIIIIVQTWPSDERDFIKEERQKRKNGKRKR
ncbi:MAG: hypothetical protein R3E90_15665 [Marinicella sp.]